MTLRTRPRLLSSLAPVAISETLADPGDAPPTTIEPHAAPREISDASDAAETPREQFRRRAHRARLHAYAFLTVALFVFLVALAASNTARVKVSWIFGTSRVSFLWIVLFGAILGWLLGMSTTTIFRWRTNAPRRQRDAAISPSNPPQEAS